MIFLLKQKTKPLKITKREGGKSQMKYSKNSRASQLKNSQEINKLTTVSLKKLHAGTSIKRRGGKKLYGIPVLSIIVHLVILVYYRIKTVNEGIKMGIIPFKKDIFYRMLAKIVFNWHAFYYD